MQKLDDDLMKLNSFNYEWTPPLINMSLGNIKLKSIDTKGYYGSNSLIYNTSADLKDSADMLDLSISAA